MDEDILVASLSQDELENLVDSLDVEEEDK